APSLVPTCPYTTLSRSSRIPDLVRHLRARRPDTFPTDAAAAAALEHPLTFGAALVGVGRADVMVGGATFPSGDTIRAALWGVGEIGRAHVCTPVTRSSR